MTPIAEAAETFAARGTANRAAAESAIAAASQCLRSATGGAIAGRPEEKPARARRAARPTPAALSAPAPHERPPRSTFPPRRNPCRSAYNAAPSPVGRTVRPAAPIASTEAPRAPSCYPTRPDCPPALDAPPSNAPRTPAAH